MSIPIEAEVTMEMDDSLSQVGGQSHPVLQVASGQEETGDLVDNGQAVPNMLIAE